MVAKKGDNDIELEDESPRLEGSDLDTGEGRTTVTSTCSEDDAGVLKPQGGTAADNATTERTAVSHRNLREKMRIGTWNVRSMNQGKLDIVKREMERIDVNLLGVSEMKWTGMGHFKSDNHEVYYVERGSSVGRMPDSQSREPGFEPRCYRFEVWAFSFTSRRLSRLSCINEYLAIDSGGNVSE